MVRNSLGIQLGEDPAAAEMRFYWRTSDGKPRAFFDSSSEEWLWPGHGARLDGVLLLLFMRVRPRGIEGMWNFEPFATAAILVENPDDSPPAWRLRFLDVPDEGRRTLLSAGVLVDDGWLYFFGVSEPEHRAHVARVAVADGQRGRLGGMEWWCGERGWLATGTAGCVPEVLFTGAQSEFTVHRDEVRGRFVLVQTEGFGASPISVRFAARPEGPWSEPAVVYRPPEAGRRDVLIYQGKAHAQLGQRGELIVTYCTNSTDFATLVSDPGLYYPRFVRLRFDRP
jgi:hypothetical protein